MQKIVKKQFKIDQKKLKLETDFLKKLGADSLDIVELVTTIENQFKIQMENSIAGQIYNIQDVTI